MKILKRSEMTAAAIAGKTAKRAGHEYEHKLAALFDNLFGGEHKVDGRPQTKVDMYEENTNRKYSIKSISKNHTQVALLSTEKFIKHFKIRGHSETFLRMFFGYPNKELKSIVQDIHPDLDLSDKEIEYRIKSLEDFKPKISKGYLSRYAKMVTSANTGAVLK